MQGEYEHDESRSAALDEEAFVRPEVSFIFQLSADIHQCDISDPSNECDNSTTTRTPLDFPLARKQWIDYAVSVKGSVPEVRSGVKFGDGDGTIAVVSLGAMCVKGWKGKTRWNPAGIPVITQGKSSAWSSCFVVDR